MSVMTSKLDLDSTQECVHCTSQHMLLCAGLLSKHFLSVLKGGFKVMRFHDVQSFEGVYK